MNETGYPSFRIPYFVVDIPFVYHFNRNKKSYFQNESSIESYHIVQYLLNISQYAHT